jgi:hypothetical protein
MSYNIIKIYLLAEADTQDLFDAVVAIESIENNAIERIEIDFERTLYIKMNSPLVTKSTSIAKSNITVPFTDKDPLITDITTVQNQVEASTNRNSGGSGGGTKIDII